MLKILSYILGWGGKPLEGIRKKEILWFDLCFLRVLLASMWRTDGMGTGRSRKPIGGRLNLGRRGWWPEFGLSQFKSGNRVRFWLCLQATVNTVRLWHVRARKKWKVIPRNLVTVWRCKNFPVLKGQCPYASAWHLRLHWMSLGLSNLFHHR